MRQAGIIPTEPEARRFADYLLTHGMEAQVDEELEGWVVWIRDENHVDEAIRLLKDFLKNPTDPAYREAAAAAGEVRRQARRQAEQVRKNMVDIRGRWDRGTARKTPITFLVIAACVLVFILTDGLSGEKTQLNSRTTWTLLFCDPGHAVDSVSDRLAEIRAGQVWRLITPIFIHWGPLHLVFNLYMFYYFGTQIEHRRGSFWLLLMIFVMGVLSVVAQSLIESPFGGGLSGVVYGLFGYVWMKSSYDPGAGLYVAPITVMILIIWFFLGVIGAIARIANTAHGAGLLVGVVWGYAPVLWTSLRRRR